MNESKWILLIQSWIIGMVVFVVHFMLGFQHVVIGVVLGIINGLLTKRILDTFHLGNSAPVYSNTVLFKTVVKEIGIGVCLSLMVRMIDYILLIKHVIDMPIEPFRYVIIYQLLYYLFKYLFNKIGGVRHVKDL